MTDLDDLEKKALEATPGPWSDDGFGNVAATKSDQLNGGYFTAECSGPNKHGNSLFIAAANPSAILDLIARCRKAEARVAELEAQSGEAIGEIIRNSAGQIFIAGPDGDYFDMSKFIGEKLYLRAPQSSETLTDSYVRQVPDKCDRIIWRGHYYHLDNLRAQQAVPEEWADAYAAFKGAFDTPQMRRMISDDYATDARKRLREFNEAVLAATPSPEGEQG